MSRDWPPAPPKKKKPFIPPNVHDVAQAIRELEKHPAVAAYLALLRAFKDDGEGEDEIH